MTSITVPEPVMSLAVAPKNRESSGAFSKALNRFTKEDPTFKVGMDAESGQTIISGMGELHLDIYVERMKREYKVSLVCRHQVASECQKLCAFDDETSSAKRFRKFPKPAEALRCVLPPAT